MKLEKYLQEGSVDITKWEVYNLIDELMEDPRTSKFMNPAARYADQYHIGKGIPVKIAAKMLGVTVAQLPKVIEKINGNTGRYDGLAEIYDDYLHVYGGD